MTHRWPGILLIAALLLQSIFPALAAPVPTHAAPSAALFPPWYSPLPARPADPSVIAVTVVGTGAPVEITQSTPPGTVLERTVVLEDGGAAWFVGGLSPGQAGSVLWLSGDRVGLGPGLAPGRTARLALIVRPAKGGPSPAEALTAAGAPGLTDIGPMQSGSTTLAIAKSDSPDPVDQGALLTYVITVTNQTTETASQVVVTDTTPTGTVFAGANVLQGGGATWFHGGLSPGQTGPYFWFTGDRIGIGSGLNTTAVLQFIVRPVPPLPDQSVLSNDNYRASAANAPEVQGAVVTTTVNAPAFALNKIESSDSITAGARLTYTILLTNTGHLTTSLPYTIVETLPAYTTYADSVPPAQVGGNVLTWTLTAPLAPGQAAQVTFAVTVTAPLTDGLTLVNSDYRAFSVEVTPTVSGPPVTTTVRSWPTLSIDKTDSPDPVPAGELVTYTLTVTNATDAIGPALGTFVTDTLPGDVMFQSCSPSCQPGQTVTWTLGTLQPGEARTLTLVGRVYSPLPNGTVLTNTAAVSATNALATVETSETTTVASAPAFTLIKSVYPSAVVAGSTVTYTIIVTNTGNETAGSATVTDTLPSAFAFGGMVQGPAPTQSGSDLIWTNQVITGVIWPTGWITPPGPLTLVFTATAGGSGMQYNAVTVTQDAVGAATGPTAPVYVSLPDLRISKTDNPDPATPGQPLAYTIVYSNASAVPATGVVITDTLPDFITGGYASPSPSGTIAAGETITWAIGPLAGNSGNLTILLVVTLTVPIADGTVLTNTAGVFCNEGVSAHTGPVTTTVRSAPAFQVTKTASHTPVRPGDRVTYTVAVTNTGTEDATGVVITDVLPAHTTFADATPPYSGPAGGVLTWTVGTLNVGASALYTLAVTVDVPLTNGLQLVNRAYVSSAQGVTGTASAVVTVQSSPILHLVKSDAPDPVPALGTLVYTLVFSNTGDAVATGVWVTDTLPTGVTLVAASPPTTTQVGNVVAWYWGTLSPLDGPQTIALTVTVGLLPDGTVLTNEALLDSDQTEPITDVETTTVQTADLVVGKWTVGPPVIGPTGLVTFSVRVTNTGSLTATGTRITDTLPAGFTAVYSEAVNATWDSGTVWTANLAPGAWAAITLSAQSPATSWGPITRTEFNTATATTASPEHDLTDNQATSSVDVIPGPPYTVTLVAVPDALPVGTLSTLTATVTDQWGNPVLNGTPVIFATTLGALIPPSGWTTTNGAATAQLTSTVAGTALVTATADSVFDTALVTFTAGAVYRFAFGPIADQVAGVDFTITITAYDAFDNIASGFNGTVVLSDVTGSLQPTTTANFVDGVLAAQTVSITVARVNQPIWAISGTIQNASNPFTVTHNLAVALDLSPKNATVMAGNTLTYSAVATDAYGNSWTATSEVTFTTSGGNTFLGASPGNGVFSATVAGVNFPITGTIAGAGGPVVATTGVTVTHGPAVSLTISPRDATATAGDWVTYTAIATDAYGNFWTATSEVTFTTSGGNAFLGTPPGNNVFSATVAGTWPVTGTLGSAVDATTITIHPGPVARLAMAPVADPQTAGVAFALAITATDAFNNRATNFTGALSLTDTTGTLNPTTATLVGGVANPSVTVFRAWVADRITATLAATPTIFVVSNPFTVVANVPYTVTYVVPSSLRVCETAPVTATVTDAWNNPVADGTVVSFTASIGLLFAESGGQMYYTMTVGGIARATLRAGTVSGLASTEARAGAASSGIHWVQVITPGLPATVTLIAAPSTIAVGGNTGILTVTVRDCAANPVADGTSVDFGIAPPLATIGPDPATTTGGVATAIFTSGMTTGAAVVTATVNSLVATTTLTFTAGPPYTVTLVANPTTLVANGTSTAALTATVTDQWGNPVANGTPVDFSLAPALGTIAPDPATTSGGIAQAIFTAGTVTGTVILTATAGSAVATATITLVPTPTHYIYLPLVLRNHGPNLVVESITWSPITPTAGESVVVTVTVRNIGSAPAGTFWVDLYLDPSQPPAPGVPWNEVSSEGVAWQVTGLAPGEARALRSDQGETGYTFWRGYFAATPNPHILYAVVDSWPYDPAETVPETNEADNRIGPIQVHMR